MLSDGDEWTAYNGENNVSNEWVGYDHTVKLVGNNGTLADYTFSSSDESVLTVESAELYGEPAVLIREVGVGDATIDFVLPGSDCAIRFYFHIV